MSMEEEAARQAATHGPSSAPQDQPIAAAAAGVGVANSNDTSAQQPSQTAAAVPAAAAPATTTTTTTTDATEEALLQQALALSEGHSGPDVEMTEEGGGDENMTEEEMIARAIEMSMHPEPESEDSEKQ
jgi:26S proteasome regulatory subunit N10